MLISNRENCRAEWINRFAWDISPFQGKGRVRVSAGMIDVLNNEPLTFILSPFNKGRGDRRRKRLVITLRTGKYRLPGIYCYPLHRSGSKARNRCSIFGKRLVWVAVEPMFARLRRCDHRMSTGARVFAGVLIRRAIAAQRDSTRLARPEMHPIGTDLHAFFAFASLRLLNRFNRIQMRTASGVHDRLV